MMEIETWLFRIGMGFFGILGTIGCAFGTDYFFNVRAGNLFRKKEDCEDLYQKLYTENREDHDKIDDKLGKLIKAVSRIEGKLQCDKKEGE